jgi:hypothetical protein
MRVKSLSIPVVAILLAAATVAFSSFSYIKKMTKATTSETLFWFFDEAATNYVEAEQIEIEDANNCGGTTRECEYGYKAEDLVDPDHPEEGLNGSAGSPAILYKN